MVEEALFAQVLGVAGAFEIADGVVIFFEMEVGVLEGLFIEVGGPAVDGLGKEGEVVGLFLEDEGYEEGALIDDDSAASAESADEGQGLFLHARGVEKLFGLSGDAHDDCGGRAAVDEADIAPVCAEQGLFKGELLQDGHVL